MTVTNSLSAADNIGVSILAGLIAFVSDSWPQVIAVIFGCIHAYIAIDKWRYEKSQREANK